MKLGIQRTISKLKLPLRLWKVIIIINMLYFISSKILLSSYVFYCLSKCSYRPFSHYAEKYNIIIHFHYFGRQAVIILCSLWLICPLSLLWLGAKIAILRNVKYSFIGFQYIQTDDVGGLVLCYDKMLMGHHGNQGRK